MQKIKITLDIIDESEDGEVDALKVQHALRGMGFRHNGMHHQSVPDERYSIPFYQFLTRIDKTAESISVAFQQAYKKEIARRLEGLADNVRITFTY